MDLLYLISCIRGHITYSHIDLNIIIKRIIFFPVLTLLKYVQLSLVRLGVEFCQVLSRWIYFFGGRDLRGRDIGVDTVVGSKAGVL